jgi:DedD protein
MSDARTVHDADEDGFHEIQLNGKQLVFLGMTTTLVSVVIFLCGVLVGRGVKPIEPVAEAAAIATAPAAPEPALAADAPPSPVPEPAAAAVTLPPTATETKPVAPAPVQPQAKPTARAANAPAPVEELSYYDALQKGSGKTKRASKTSAPAVSQRTPEPAPKAPVANVPAPNAQAQSSPAPVVPESAATAPAVPDAAPAPDAEAAAPATAAKSGGAIAVQVAALANRADAEAIARRLSGKGYAAYVLSPVAGAKQVFKVRVGNYASVDEADRVARRLQQEEKLQPWVIR